MLRKLIIKWKAFRERGKLLNSEAGFYCSDQLDLSSQGRRYSVLPKAIIEDKMAKLEEVKNTVSKLSSWRERRAYRKRISWYQKYIRIAYEIRNEHDRRTQLQEEVKAAVKGGELQRLLKVENRLDKIA
jgi:hypothetical protein